MKNTSFSNEGEDTSNCAIACVNISGMFAFDPASHQIFRGGVRCGVKQEKIGDILVKLFRG